MLSCVAINSQPGCSYLMHPLTRWPDSSVAHTLANKGEWISDEITNHNRSSTDLEILKANKMVHVNISIVYDHAADMYINVRISSRTKRSLTMLHTIYMVECQTPQLNPTQLFFYLSYSIPLKIN